MSCGPARLEVHLHRKWPNPNQGSPSSRLFSLSGLWVYCLDPFATPAALDLQARAGNRIFWLFSSCEVSQASIGKRSNRLPEWTKKQVRKNGRDHFQTMTANLLCSLVLTQ